MKPSKRITIDIWDNGGRTTDRYTIAISGIRENTESGNTYVTFLGASHNPFSPNGYGEHVHEIETESYFLENYAHLGKRIGWYDLPADVRRFVASELMPE